MMQRYEFQSGTRFALDAKPYSVEVCHCDPPCVLVSVIFPVGQNGPYLITGYSVN